MYAAVQIDGRARLNFCVAARISPCWQRAVALAIDAAGRLPGVQRARRELLVRYYAGYDASRSRARIACSCAAWPAAFTFSVAAGPYSAAAR